MFLWFSLIFLIFSCFFLRFLKFGNIVDYSNTVINRGVLKKRCSENMQQIYRRTPWRNVISISNFIEITLQHGCSTVNLLHISRTAFLKNTSGRLLLSLYTSNLTNMHQTSDVRGREFYGTITIKCQCCPHIEICCTNHLTGLYMRATLALNGLIY